MKTCPVCGQVFVSVRRLNCSKRCTKKKWKMKNRDRVNIQQRAWFKKRARKDWKEKTCEVCSKIFLPPFKNHKFQIYCSTQCRQRGVNRKCKIQNREILRNPALNPEKYLKIKLRSRVQSANWHAKKRGCLKGKCRSHHIHFYEWVELKERLGNKCNFCGKMEDEKNVLTIDHVIPLSKGGHNTISNVQPLCRSCNSKKGNRLM